MSKATTLTLHRVFILVITISVALFLFAIPAVRAQTDGSGTDPSTATQAVQQATNPSTQTQQPATTQSGTADACNWTSFNLVNCIASGIAKMLASFLWTLVGLFAFLLSIVGAVFNFAALITIFQFSNYLGNSSGVLLAWGVLRDISNILLLFAFIYTGVLIILGNQNYGVGKTLPRLLIFAVLLNFSLFATEAIIDIGNGLSSTLYTQASGFNCGGGAGDRAGFAACAEQGIAGSLMTASGITSINQWQSGYSSILGTSDGTMALIGSAGVLALVVILLGVLAAGAILLFVRAITLVLLMVTSPIGFAGPVIPGFSSMGKQWWDTLRNNVIFAPIFILLILVGFKIIEGVRNGLGLQNGVNLINIFTTGTPTTVGQGLAIFILTAGFFIAALIGSQKFAKVGTQMTSGIVKSANGLLGLSGRAGLTATTGAAAMLARNTIGRGADATSRFIRRNPILGTNTPAWLQKALTTPFDYGASASYDVLGLKSIPGVGKTGDYVKATKGGFRETRKQDRAAIVKMIDETVSARNTFWNDQRKADWEKKAEKRKVKSLQFQDRIDAATDPKERERWEEQKIRWDAVTEGGSHVNKKQHDQIVSLLRDISKADRAIAAEAAKPKDARDEALMQNFEKLKKSNQEQIKNIRQNGEFEQKYVEQLQKMNYVLKKIFVGEYASKRLLGQIQKDLHKESGEKWLDELTERLKKKEEGEKK